MDGHNYEINVAPDKMQVSLRVMTAKPHTITEEEVLAALIAHGVCHGIDRAAIAATVRVADGRSHVVARGRMPEPGVNGHLQWLVQPVHSAAGADERAGEFPPVVDAGVRLAVVVPPAPGRPGLDVLGQLVPVDAPLLCKAVAGPGVELHGDTLISSREGRPIESAVGSVVAVKVLPYYQHLGYVDVSSGHLDVNGDLLITGSITAGMQVQAAGSITVRGHVLQADVRAGGSVTVHGNVIGSTVVAGGRQAFYRSLLPNLTALDQRLGDLALMVDRVLRDQRVQAQHLDRSGLAAVLHRLTETSFADLLRHAQALADQVAAAPDRRDELAQLLGIFLNAKLLGNRLTAVRSPAELTQARQLLTRIQVTMGLESAGRCSIAVPYCEQSTLRSSGTIRVGHRGSYKSELVAHERIAVQGAVLGGSLVSQGSVEAGALGNDAGIPTVVTVGALGRIRAAAAHQGVAVRVGDVTTRVRDRTSLDLPAETKSRFE